MAQASAPRATRQRRRAADGREVIEQAALRAFYARGYHGTSTRDLAAEAGMTAASLYHHFESKQEILRIVMTQIMQDALSTTRAAVLRSGGSPTEQLTGLVRAWVEFHARRQIEAQVGLSELNSLEPEGRRLVVALRDEQEHMFREVVQRGVESHEFGTTHPTEASRAVLNMGTAVATWFRSDGSETPEQVADTYADLALALVGARTPQAGA